MNQVAVAGITDGICSVAEIVKLIETEEAHMLVVWRQAAFAWASSAAALSLLARHEREGDEHHERHA